MFYAAGLEEFINLYHQKDTVLNFIELKFSLDNSGNMFTVDNNVFNTNEMESFKNKFYYNLFKGEYLDHYINKNNLKIRKLVTNIFN